MRIASLLASATEMVCALGLGDRLVGISHECDYPAEVRDKPRLSQPRFAFAAKGGQEDDGDEACSSHASMAHEKTPFRAP